MIVIVETSIVVKYFDQYFSLAAESCRMHLSVATSKVARS